MSASVERREVREIELETGEVISPVTRVVDGGDGLMNVHTPGSGYRVVAEGAIIRDSVREAVA